MTGRTKFLTAVGISVLIVTCGALGGALVGGAWTVLHWLVNDDEADDDIEDWIRALDDRFLEFLGSLYTDEEIERGLFRLKQDAGESL